MINKIRENKTTMLVSRSLHDKIKELAITFDIPLVQITEILLQNGLKTAYQAYEEKLRAKLCKIKKIMFNE